MKTSKPPAARLSIFALMILALAFLTLSDAGSAEAPHDRDVSADLKAIEELHQKDIAAAKSYDVETLVSLWSDDIVALAPGQKPTIGKETARAQLEAGRAASQQFETLDYREDWKEVKVVGDYAFEWGVFGGAARSKADGKVVSEEYNVMRVLKRQPDGSWKVHRTIWNQAPKK